MTKVNCNVNDLNAVETHPQNDTFFRNCVCATLVFGAMCGLIVVLATVTRINSPPNGRPIQNQNMGDKDELTDRIPEKVPGSDGRFDIDTSYDKEITKATTDDIPLSSMQSTFAKDTNDDKLTTEITKDTTTTKTKPTVSHKLDVTIASSKITEDVTLSSTKITSVKGINDGEITIEVTNPTTTTTKPTVSHKLDDKNASSKTTEVDTTVSSTEPTITSTTPATKKTVTSSISTVRQSTESSTEMTRNQDNQKNFTDNENKELSNKNECNTTTCKSTASRILSFMDYSADYCNNFYGFSCGGLITETEDDYLTDVWKQMLKVVRDASPPAIFIDRFKMFYESCVAHEEKFEYSNRVQAVKEIIGGAGEIILNGNTTVDKVKFTNLMAKLVLIGSFPVMDVNIDVDRNTHKYVIQVTLPDSNLKASVMSDWSTLLEDGKRCLSQKQTKFEDTLNLAEVHNSILDCRKVYSSFANAVENTVGEVSFYGELDQKTIADKTANMFITIDLDIMRQVNDVKVSDIQSTMMNKNYKEVKIADFQEKWKVIDWSMFFKELVGYTLPDNTSVHVYFYERIDKVMQNFEFMMSRKDRSKSLYNSLLVLYATDIYQNTVVPKHKENREKYCLELSSYLFHDVSTYVYMNSPKGKKAKVQEKTISNIFNILKTNLINATEESNSFEEPDVIVKKMNKLQVNFASTSEECLNIEKLTKKYNTSNKIGQSFAKNLIWSMEFHRRHFLALAGRTFNEMDMFCYFLHPYDVKPKSFYAKEIIAVPYGILRNIPDDEPGYVLMARVGIHLAQGIGMHFDPVGITYGMKLNRKDADIYKELMHFFKFQRTRVINKQNVTFEKSDLTINSEIADNMGLRMISDTYNKLQNNVDLPWIGNSFTQEQIFFISTAQEFCEKVDVVDYMLDIYERGILPASMRVEIMFATSKEFADVFKCLKGTAMNIDGVPQVQFPYLNVKRITSN